MTVLEFIKDKFKSSHKNNKFYMKRLRDNGNSVFDYDFIMSLDKKDYPEYLSLAYFVKTGEKLNLKHPKTLNEKIQWLKIYDNKPIKTTLTDKVLVRDWVKEKIGDEYLKPVLWIGKKFDDIPFEKLTDKFIIKCNHWCKGQISVENKNEFLKKAGLLELIKNQFNSWMAQTYFGWSDFEVQYLNIEPKILIEPLLIENDNEAPQEIEVWCFNGKAVIIQKCVKIYKNNRFSHRQVSSFDENFNQYDIKFYESNEIVHIEPDNLIKEAKVLSEKLANKFKLVRVDWMIFQNKLYFAEMTFTPHSGFIFFGEDNYKLQLELGKMLKMKGD